jgi:spore coat protein CotH
VLSKIAKKTEASYCVASLVMPDGETVKEVPMSYKGVWTAKQVEKDGYHGQVSQFVYNGQIYKGVFMIYTATPKA